ncbi:MAG: hypothetical protein ACPGUD_10855 [Parashewanella sp.]
MTTSSIPPERIDNLLVVNGLSPDKNNIDFIENAQLCREPQDKFFNRYDVKGICRVPQHDHATIPDSRYFDRFTLSPNNAVVGEKQLVIAIIQSGCDGEQYQPPILDANSAAVYVVRKVENGLNYAECKDFSHTVANIWSIESLKKQMVTRYSKSRDLSEDQIHNAEVARVRYERVNELLTCEIILKLEQQGVTAPFEQLIDALSLPEQVSMDSIKQLMKKQFRRAQGKERWHQSKIELSDANKAKCYCAFKQLGLLTEIPPTETHYDHAVVLGCTIPMMEKRLLHLATLAPNTLGVKTIYILTGSRKLKQDIDELSSYQSKTTTQLNTEADAANLLALLHQQQFHNIQIQVITAENVIRNDEPDRANTADTMFKLLKDEQLQGQALLISNQPHAQYQLASCKKVTSLMQSQIELHVAALAAEVDTPLDRYFNSIESCFRQVEEPAVKPQFVSEAKSEPHS